MHSILRRPFCCVEWPISVSSENRTLSGLGVHRSSPEGQAQRAQGCPACWTTHPLYTPNVTETALINVCITSSPHAAKALRLEFTKTCTAASAEQSYNCCKTATPSRLNQVQSPCRRPQRQSQTRLALHQLALEAQAPGPSVTLDSRDPSEQVASRRREISFSKSPPESLVHSFASGGFAEQRGGRSTAPGPRASSDPSLEIRDSKFEIRESRLKTGD